MDCSQLLKQSICAFLALFPSLRCLRDCLLLTFAFCQPILEEIQSQVQQEICQTLIGMHEALSSLVIEPFLIGPKPKDFSSHLILTAALLLFVLDAGRFSA